MKIIKRLDNRLMELIRKNRRPDDHFKYRSWATIFGIGMPYLLVSAARTNKLWVFPTILIIAAIICGCWFLLHAVYEWRYFFALRKSGLNNDKNYFFDESAGKHRKWLFYISACLFFALGLWTKHRTADLPYMLKSTFYLLAWMAALRSFCFAIVLVELGRVIYPLAARWSDRKHFGVVIVTSIILSILSTIGLLLGRGQSVF